MKILMVCTYPHGGATIAARRQAEALRASGENCSLVSIKEDWGSSDTRIFQNGHEITINVPAFLWSYSGRITTAYCNNNRADISNTWFSFWPCELFLDQALLKVCLEYDVIHFHWIAQMVSSRLLTRLKAYGRRILFTGHDMNHFTGGCHYSAGCDSYKQGCISCPQLISDPLNLVPNSFYQKISAFAALQATWLFPSIWLADAFRQSRLQDHPAATKLLYNCIDTEKFHYLSHEARATRRQAMGIADNELVFVAGAADNTELRKGFDYIENGVRHLSSVLNTNSDNRRFCVIVTFGHGKPWLTTQSPYVRHLHLGSIDEEKVVTLFQAADLLLFPSVEENFSNTILESLMCGCPVFAFRIGGVPDIVVHETNGWIVDTVSLNAFAEGMSRVIQTDKLRELRISTLRWRDQHVTRYSYPQIANELLEVYRDTEAVTRPCIVNLPADIVSTEQLYAALFSEAATKDPQEHNVLAANIARHVVLAKEERLLQSDNLDPSVIPAIFSGFGGAEQHDELGRVSWLLKESHVFFKQRGDARPALCIQVSNINWITDLLDTALSKLSAAVNGQPVEVRCIKSGDERKFLYLWVVPEPRALVSDTYNTLTLSFSESTIPENKDSRGLCILHCQATLFDLNAIATHTGFSTAPNFETSTALALKASQIHYLWQNWTAETNADATLPNAVEAWIDVMRGGTQILESGT